jgi:hypothetical protein
MHNQQPWARKNQPLQKTLREVIVKALNLSEKLKLKMSLLPRKASKALLGDRDC